MNRGDQNPHKNQKDKDKMLDELESLSKMLEEDRPRRFAQEKVLPQDIPILKSFVGDVPTLSDSLEASEPPIDQNATKLDSYSEAVDTIDSIDNSAATFTTAPVSSAFDQGTQSPEPTLDVSFLDNPVSEENLSAELHHHLVDGTGDNVLHELEEKAGPLVDALVKAYLPKLEAELRMKLEQEVDRILDTFKKNTP